MSSSYSLTEETPTSTLIAACVQGDPASHALFVTRYGQFIERAVKLQFYRMNQPSVPGVVEVEDIAQDILTRLLSPDYVMLRSIEHLERIDAWLMRVAQRTTIDQLRKLKAQRKLKEQIAQEDQDAYTEAPTTTLVAEETRAEVRALLERLSEKDRLFLQLYYLDGCSYAEIALMTRTNINTVASNLRRARTRMRATLQDEAHE